MHTIIILLLVTMLIALKMQSNAPKFWRSMLLGCLAGAALLAGIGLSRPARESAQMRERVISYNEAAGQMLGRQIAREIDADQEIVMLYTDMPDATAQLALESQMDGVVEGMGTKGYRVTRARIKLMGGEDPELSDEEWIEQADQSPSEYLRPYLNAGAVVFMPGQPGFAMNRIPSNLPPFFVCNAIDNPVMRTLVERGVVRAAVVYKRDLDINAVPHSRMSIEELFAMRYELLTAK